jgi:hypothetical protein
MRRRQRPQASQSWQEIKARMTKLVAVSFSTSL